MQLRVEVSEMTWAFDTIQEFLAHIKTVKEPELFETAIQYIQRLMATIHEIDHVLDQRIAKGIDGTSAYQAIKKFNQEAERRRVK